MSVYIRYWNCKTHVLVDVALLSTGAEHSKRPTWLPSSSLHRSLMLCEGSPTNLESCGHQYSSRESLFPSLSRPYGSASRSNFLYACWLVSATRRRSCFYGWHNRLPVPDKVGARGVMHRMSSRNNQKTTHYSFWKQLSFTRHLFTVHHCAIKLYFYNKM